LDEVVLRQGDRGQVNKKAFMDVISQEKQLKRRCQRVCGSRQMTRGISADKKYMDTTTNKN
jgi:hypothetical protein